NAAIEAMAELGPKAVYPLIKALRDKDRSVHCNAARALGRMGPGARRAVPALIRVLHWNPNLKNPPTWPNMKLRAKALDALGEIGPVAKRAIPRMIKLMDIGTEQMRIHGGRVKVRTGGGHAPVNVRISAARAFGKMGPVAGPAVPILIKNLKHKNAKVRRTATLALGQIGSAAEAAVPVLIKELKEKPLEGAEALSGIGPKAAAATPALVETLKHKDWRVRETAARALGKIGPAAKAAVPQLTEALKDENTEVRAVAGEAIKKIQAE
ncbi:MAG: HEAT repeat domain-containing protein, partial [Phycisphaerae bacterium]|nr:HEAT repeat domain-containing protein [Phycisphaerae bacterium]